VYKVDFCCCYITISRNFYLYLSADKKTFWAELNVEIESMVSYYKTCNTKISVAQNTRIHHSLGRDEK